LARHAGFTGLGEKDPLLEVTRSGRFESVQSYFNVLNPSAGFAGTTSGADDFGGIIDVAATSGVGVIVIRPFAAGALSAQPERHPNAGDPGGPLTGGATYEADLDRARAVEPIAAELGFESPLELGLRFVQAKQGVSTVIVGYSNLDHLESAIRWTERGPLSDDVVARVMGRP
jgi:aryl-alcohol dehydrogenase-like predicted oxidoreductase